MTGLTEEQSMVRDIAAAWVREKAPVSAFRQVHDGRFPLQFDPGLYAEMAEMGWAGMIVPEAYGGVDFGYRGLGLVVEALGRNLAASPLVASALGAAGALARAGDEAQKQRWLPGLASGEVIATLAVDEGPRHDPRATAMTARPTPAGWRLNGVKRPTAEGLAADLVIVAARTSGAPGESGGLTLFLVETTTPGLDRRALDQIDARGAAVLTFHEVEVGPEAMLGGVDAGAPLLDKVLDGVRAGLAAEMLGGAAQAFETTLDYLKTRVQFGQVIGRFQALQHRMAALYGELELTRSAVEAALTALDADDPETPRLVSLAKALAGDTARLVSNEMIQLHGGIGMTEEHDAGLYLKRARCADAAFGNAAFHRERWARLSGY